MITMKGFYVKLPDNDAEKLKQICANLNKSCYKLIQELIYRFMEDQGVIERPKPAKELEELKKRVERLEKELEKIKKSNLFYYMKK